MSELEVQFLGKRYFAKEIAPHLPLKTMKQIRDQAKRRISAGDEIIVSAQIETNSEPQIENTPSSTRPGLTASDIGAIGLSEYVRLESPRSPA
jgi:hypothetical protein